MNPLPETTVGTLAQQLGVTAEVVMEICQRRQILVWSAATPLGQQEAELVWLTLRPPPPPAPGSFVAAPAAQPPPVASTTPGAQAPPPPVRGPMGPAGPPLRPGPPEPPGPPIAPWATRPTKVGTFPPPPHQNRTGWIIAGVCLSAFAFLAVVSFLVGTTEDEPSGDSFSFGDDNSLDPGSIDADPIDFGDEPVVLDAPVLDVPDYDTVGQTEGRPNGLGEFAIGDCVNLPDGFLVEDTIETQTIFPRPVDCQEAHNAEVFQVGEFDAPSHSSAPGGQELFSAGGEACFDSFMAYIESGFDDHDFVVLVPLDQQWERLDERLFTCFAYRLDADTTVGSMRDRAND